MNTSGSETTGIRRLHPLNGAGILTHLFVVIWYTNDLCLRRIGGGRGAGGAFAPTKLSCGGIAP